MQRDDPLQYFSDLVSFGYYRVLRLSRGKYITCTDRQQVKVAAGIYCAMNPFDYKVACYIQFHIHIEAYWCASALMECIRRFHVPAFRFLAGSIHNITDGAFGITFFELGFHPGYAEALVTDPLLLIDCDLVEYATPKGYDEIAEEVKAPTVAKSAIDIGNYSLARHIRATSKGDFVGDLVRALVTVDELNDDKIRRSKEIFYWMQREGWITSE